MYTFTYPKASLLPLRCPRCGEQKTDSSVHSGQARGLSPAQTTGHPRLTAETRATWQTRGALRAERLHARELQGGVVVASLDEFRVGSWWVYTLTEACPEPVEGVKSQAVVGYSFSERCDERVVGELIELIATHDPQALISDGCQTIAAARAYFADKPQGRCWFHVIKARYGEEQLAPLFNAWGQLKQYWLIAGMPLTNNASGTLYRALWPRMRKRAARALHRARDWFMQALWRWHHHLICGKSPWQRFCGRPSPHWLTALLTPLGRSSDF